MSAPPKLASILLKRFGPHNDALTGDLHEAHLAGKSRWWYWGQVLTIILNTNERILIARGVVVGWVTLHVFHLVGQPLNHELMGTHLLDWFIVNLGSHPFVMLYAVVLWNRPIEIAAYVISGWVVGQTHRSCRSMAVFTFMTVILVRSAWTTARWFKMQAQMSQVVAYPIPIIVLSALPLMILLDGWMVRPDHSDHPVSLA